MDKTNNIPKIIHYCWYGGKKLPPSALKCIRSWKKYCPDYRIIEWNESNTDLNRCVYIKQAYEAKKWAFVSDFVRFSVLYEYGGVYLDTDVQLIKSLDPILANGSFMGIGTFSGDYTGGTDTISVQPGLGMAAEAKNAFFGQIIDYYENMKFILSDGKQNLDTVGMHITSLLKQNGLKDENRIQNVCGILIYPKEYFNPMDFDTGKVHITEKTVSIHHFAASWVGKHIKIRDKSFQLIFRIFGKRAALSMKNLYRKIFLNKPSNKSSY